MALTRSKKAPSSHLTHAALGQLMPLHLILSPHGRVRSAGGTMMRLFAEGELIGRSLFSLFDVRGPGQITKACDLLAPKGGKLQLKLRGSAPEVPGLRLRGLAVPLAGEGGGIFVNLSFGIDIGPAIRLLQLSALDFAPTDMTMELLYLSEANAVVTSEMRALSRRLERARVLAEEKALTDALTGLHNRRAFDASLARVCRERAGFSLLQLDLDHFKGVNDTHGHAAGDQLLAQVAAALRVTVPQAASIARLGGDEFAVILPHRLEPAQLSKLGADLMAAFAAPPEDGLPISASMGALCIPKGLEISPVRVMAAVDLALYRAKGAGRGKIELAPSFETAVSNVPQNSPMAVLKCLLR